MDARPQLERVARALELAKLEAVLIGNAAAALRGAPVTTLDFDFMFRDTPVNRRKLKAFARALGATVLRPYYPVSSLFRVADEASLQVDFMPHVHGVRTFEGLRARADRLELGDASLLVADLADIPKSRRAAAVDRRIAPCSTSSKKRSMKRRRKPTRAEKLTALRKETEADLRAQIRRLLALPMEKRTNFLRVRLPGGGSAA